MRVNFLQIDRFINTNEDVFCLFAFFFRKIFSLGKQYSTTEIFEGC